MKERLIRFKHAPSESLVGSKQQQIWSKSRIFRYIFPLISFSFQICPIKITLRCIVCSCCFNSNSDANSINTYLSCGQGKKGTNDWTVNLLKNIRIIMCERTKHKQRRERKKSNNSRVMIMEAYHYGKFRKEKKMYSISIIAWWGLSILALTGMHTIKH